MVDKFSLYYQNCRGLRSKSSTFFVNFIGCDYDILCLTETWFNSYSNNSDYFTNDYYIFRSDRTYTPTLTLGGGALIAVKKSLKVFRRFDLDFNGIECVWLEIKINPDCTILLGNLYLSQRVQVDLIQQYSDFLSANIDTVSVKVIFIGDFNLPELNWDTGISYSKNYYVKAKSDIFYTLISVLNLDQKNSIKLNPDDNLLDLIFTNFDNELNVSQASVNLVNVDFSHPCLHACIDIPTRIFNDNFTPFSKFNFAKGDYLGLYYYISHHSFSDSDSIPEVVNDLTELIIDGINNFVPKITVKPLRYPSWFSPKLISSLHKKEKFHKKLKKKPDNTYFKTSFNYFRKLCKKLLITDRRTYNQRVESNLTHKPDSFWRFVKLQYKNIHEINIVENGQLVNSDLVPDKFATHFSSVFEKGKVLAKNIPFSDIICTDSKPLVLPPFINARDVLGAIKSLKCSKTSGPDQIPSFIVKGCMNTLAPVLCRLFNMCLNTGHFPDSWKISSTVPVPKKGNLTLVTNYRPISLLCVFSKIFEKIIVKHLSFMLKNSLSTNQHGFIAGRSTVTNLVSFLQNTGPSVLKRGQVDVVYFDLSSAFDIVNHNLLLTKLQHYGLSPLYIEFIKSYISNRRFQVKVGKFLSSTYPSDCGVPQGSNLGPLLFILFFNDVCNSIVSHFDLFADDLKVYRTIKSPSDIDILQRDINSISNWCFLNGMQYNKEKIYTVTYTRKLTPYIHDYILGDRIIIKKDIHTDLGVIFDSKLLFNSHVDNIVSKARRTSAVVGWVAKGFFLPLSHITLYNSLVRSKLEYCSEVWGNLGITTTDKIDVVQRLFLRKLTFKLFGHSLHYKDSLSMFQLATLEQRRKFKEIMFIYKIIHNFIDSPGLLQMVNFNVPQIRARKFLPFYLTNRQLSSLIPLNRFMVSANQINDIDFNITPKEAFSDRLKTILFVPL